MISNTLDFHIPLLVARFIPARLSIRLRPLPGLYHLLFSSGLLVEPLREPVKILGPLFNIGKLQISRLLQLMNEPNIMRDLFVRRPPYLIAFGRFLLSQCGPRRPVFSRHAVNIFRDTDLLRTMARRDKRDISEFHERLSIEIDHRPDNILAREPAMERAQHGQPVSQHEPFACLPLGLWERLGRLEGDAAPAGRSSPGPWRSNILPKIPAPSSARSCSACSTERRPARIEWAGSRRAGDRRADHRPCRRARHEQIHFNFAVANGGTPATTHFSFPHGTQTFQDRGTFLATQQLGEELTNGALLAWIKDFATMGQPRLAQIGGQLLQVEGGHRVVGRVLLGAEPWDNWGFGPVTLTSFLQVPEAVMNAGFLSPRPGNDFTFHPASATFPGVINTTP
jgi:hypothetical protein